MKLTESETLELKPSLSQRKEIIQTISAFSNAKGGRILIGISRQGKVLGLQIGKDTIEGLTNKIKDNTEPTIYPEISVKEIEGKKIIEIKVKESKEKPVLAFGRAFKRVGKSTLKVDKDEHEGMVLEKRKVYFDELICEEARLEDIDEEKVRWFLRKAKAERNFDVDPETPLKEALERLKLTKDKRLTNAAVLLFGKDPQKFFLQAKVRCARFKGIKGLDYLDMKVFDGIIPELREKAMKFIMQHTKHAVYFDANRRYDKWEYPLRALEEVLTNALAHREYDTTAEIQVSVYDDRIEVWNPGELPKPLTPEDLKKEHKSIPRNPLIADMLFLIKYIEKWGRGTNRVIEEILENKLPEPIFQNLSGGFEVIILGPGKEFEEEIEKEKLHVLEINERQKKAIEYIKEKGKITRNNYCQLNRIGSTYAKKELNDLLEKKIIKRKGKGKSTYYMLVSE